MARLKSVDPRALAPPPVDTSLARDAFASAALTALLDADLRVGGFAADRLPQMAQNAYAVADAMIAARGSGG